MSTIVSLLSSLGYSQIIDTGVAAFSKYKNKYANLYTCLKNNLSAVSIKNIGILDIITVDLVTAIVAIPKYTRLIQIASNVVVASSFVDKRSVVALNSAVNVVVFIVLMIIAIFLVLF